MTSKSLIRSASDQR